MGASKESHEYAELNGIRKAMLENIWSRALDSSRRASIKRSEEPRIDEFLVRVIQGVLAQNTMVKLPKNSRKFS